MKFAFICIAAVLVAGVGTDYLLKHHKAGVASFFSALSRVPWWLMVLAVIALIFFTIEKW